MNYQEKYQLFKKLEKSCDNVMSTMLKGIEYDDAYQMTRAALWASLEQIEKLYYDKGLARYASAIRLVSWKCSREKRQIRGLVRTPEWVITKQQTEILDKINKMNNYISIDQSYNNSNNTIEATFITDEGSSIEKLVAQIDENINKKYILKIISQQSPKNAQIVSMYYGLGKYPRRTLKEIGELFNISLERAGQIIRRFKRTKVKYFNREDYEL